MTQPSGKPLLLRNGRVLNPSAGEYTEGDLLAVSGRIAEAGPGLVVPPGADVRDLRGAYVLPGLIDAHVQDPVAGDWPFGAATSRWLRTRLRSRCRSVGRWLARLICAAMMSGWQGEMMPSASSRSRQVRIVRSDRPSSGGLVAAWIAAWIALQRTSIRWDLYPFILLNLCLSCLAAVQGIILQISANRGDKVNAVIAVHTENNTDKLAGLAQHTKNNTDKLAVQSDQLLDLQQQQMELLKSLNVIQAAIDGIQTRLTGDPRG